MSGTLFDHTIAKRRAAPHTTIDKTTGKIVLSSASETEIRIHVSKPKGDEVMPAGLHVDQEDVVIYAKTSYNLAVGDVLEFWDAEYRIAAELRRYDMLAALVNHARRSYIGRKMKPADE